MKLLKKTLSILLSFVMILGIFSGIPAVEAAENAKIYLDVADLNDSWDANWMRHLPDRAKLNELSIPGTTTPARST